MTACCWFSQPETLSSDVNHVAMPGESFAVSATEGLQSCERLSAAGAPEPFLMVKDCGSSSCLINRLA